MTGAGFTVPPAGGGGGTDLGNGWTMWAHTGAASANNNSVTTSAIDTTSADLIVVAVAWSVDEAPATVTDSKSNTWSGTTRYSGGSGGNANIYLFYCVSPTVGSGHTFSFTDTGGFPAIAVVAVSGVNTGSPLDAGMSAGIGNNSSTTNAVNGGGTPGFAADLFVTYLTNINDTGGTPSIDSGMTITNFTNFVTGTNVGCGMAVKTQAGTGLFAPTWSWTSAGANAAGIRGFKHS